MVCSENPAVALCARQPGDTGCSGAGRQSSTALPQPEEERTGGTAGLCRVAGVAVQGQKRLGGS